MNVLIIHAHPEPRSFNGALTRTAVRALREQGHTVEVSDLFAMRLTPEWARPTFPHDRMRPRTPSWQRHLRLRLTRYGISNSTYSTATSMRTRSLASSGVARRS